MFELNINLIKFFLSYKMMNDLFIFSATLDDCCLKLQYSEHRKNHPGYHTLHPLIQRLNKDQSVF